MIPKTIADLIAQLESQGGHAEQYDDRRWDCFIARRMVDGTVSQTRVGTVGYYVNSAGKNVIGSNIHEVRDWLRRCPKV